MKYKLILLLVFIVTGMQAQIIKMIDFTKTEEVVGFDLLQDEKKKNVFTGGNIDFGKGSVIQGSADVLNLEFYAGKVKIPAILKIGAVTDLNSESGSINNNVTNDIHSSYGGVGVFGINSHKEFGVNTKNGFSIPYFIGTKYLSGLDSINSEKVNFFAFQGNAGLSYQSVVKANDVEGRFWVLASFASFIGDQESLNQIYGSEMGNLLLGGNFEFGIKIKNVVNVRLGYYKYFNETDIEDINNGVWKIAFNYGK